MGRKSHHRAARVALPLLLAAGALPANAAPSKAKSTGPKLEVAFVLDATGSMGAYIDDARNRIRAVAAELSAGEPRPDVRFALVAFRDKGDAFVTRTTPLTPDVSVMHAALTALSADGGGDTPEAVLEGVRDAIHGLKWTAPAKSGSADSVLRMIYVIGDAEPQHYSDGPKENDLLKAALSRGIIIQTIICGEPGSSGRAFFERIAARSEGRAVSLADAARGAAAARSGIGGGTGHEAPTTVGSTISGTTRTYAADTLRVDFASAPAVPVAMSPLPVPRIDTSGLLGSQLRHVTDAITFSDLWRAHTSLSEADVPPPVVDFSRQQVIVTGGADAGLAVTSLGSDAAAGFRSAHLAAAEPGVRFYLIPASKDPVIVALRTGEE